MGLKIMNAMKTNDLLFIIYYLLFIIYYLLFFTYLHVFYYKRGVNEIGNLLANAHFEPREPNPAPLFAN